MATKSNRLPSFSKTKRTIPPKLARELAAQHGVPAEDIEDFAFIAQHEGFENKAYADPLVAERILAAQKGKPDRSSKIATRTWQAWNELTPEQKELSPKKLFQELQRDAQLKKAEPDHPYFKIFIPTVGIGITAGSDYVQDAKGEDKKQILKLLRGEAEMSDEEAIKSMHAVIKRNDAYLRRGLGLKQEDLANIPPEHRRFFRSRVYNMGPSGAEDQAAKLYKEGNLEEAIKAADTGRRRAQVPARHKAEMELFKTPPVTPEVAPAATPEVAPAATPEVAPAAMPEVAPEALPAPTPLYQEILREIEASVNPPLSMPTPAPIIQEIEQAVNMPQPEVTPHAAMAMPMTQTIQTAQELFPAQFTPQQDAPPMQRAMELLQQPGTPSHPMATSPFSPPAPGAPIPTTEPPPAQQPPSMVVDGVDVTDRLRSLLAAQGVDYDTLPEGTEFEVSREDLGLSPPPTTESEGILDYLAKKAYPEGRQLNLRAAVREGFKRGFGMFERAGEVFPTLKGTTLFKVAEAIREAPALQVPEGFQSSGLLENMVSFTVSEAPLMLMPMAKIAKGTRAATSALGLTAQRVKRSNTLKLLDRAIVGGVSMGTFGAAGTGLKQVQEGYFSPEEIALVGLFGAGLGAAGNPLLGMAQRTMRKALPARQTRYTRFAEAYEPGVPTSRLIPQEEALKAKTLAKEMWDIEDRIAEVTSTMANESFPKVMRETARNKLPALYREHVLKQVSAHDIMQGPAFQHLKAVKESIGSTKVKIGKDTVNLYDTAISPRGVLVTPEQINILSAVDDLSVLRALGDPTMDVVRLVNKLDTSIRGPLRQLLVDPIDKAFTIKAQQVDKYKTKLATMVKELNIDKSARRQRELFKYAEGNPLKDAKPPTVDELRFIDQTKRWYADWLSSINRTRDLLGLEKVTRREDYVTHLTELSLWDQLGMKRGTMALHKKSQTGKEVLFRFAKQRENFIHKQNLIEAIDAYIEPAMRQIHVSKRAAEVSARAQFLPPNLRENFTRWINSSVMGGKSTGEKLFESMGLEGLLKVSESAAAALTRGIIGGSLNVTVQQFSQIPATLAHAGLRHTTFGLAQAFRKPPPNLYKISTFLPARTIKDEMVKVHGGMFKKFDNFLGATVGLTDSFVARASWYAGLNKAKSIGLSDRAAVRYADDVARMLHGSYQEIHKAPILRGRTGRAFLSFQTFGFNLWNRVVRDPKVLAQLQDTNMLREFMKISASLMATNYIYEALQLSAPHPGQLPHEMSIAGVTQAAQDATTILPPIASLGRGKLPSPLLSSVYEEVKSVTTPWEKNEGLFINMLIAGLSEDREAREKAIDSAIKGGARWIPGGVQALNTIRGIHVNQEGHYKVGHKRVDLDEIDKALMLFLGPTRSPKIINEFEMQRIRRLHNKYGTK